MFPLFVLAALDTMLVILIVTSLLGVPCNKIISNVSYESICFSSGVKNVVDIRDLQAEFLLLSCRRNLVFGKEIVFENKNCLLKYFFKKRKKHCFKFIYIHVKGIAKI